MSNSLASVHPELIPEWSERNLPLTPDKITFGSNKRVWWKGACGHEWETSVKARSKGEKCPICSGARVIEGINDLVTLKPLLAQEWSEKNKLKPTEVSVASHKAFIEGMGGYSIYASSLDGSDKCVRLEAYMADEHGGKDGWKIEKCYVKDDSNREMLDIIAGKFFIAYAPIESEKFLSMPKELARKYEEKFKYPERFYKSLDGIEAKPYKPVSKDMER